VFNEFCFFVRIKLIVLALFVYKGDFCSFETCVWKSKWK